MASVLRGSPCRVSQTHKGIADDSVTEGRRELREVPMTEREKRDQQELTQKKATQNHLESGPDISSKPAMCAMVGDGEGWSLP